MNRIAWFSPFPPVRTGIAGRSAELVALLRSRGYAIDTYPERAAHDFPWRHRLAPYDLVVYQFGNSSHHDYEWPYALRYPGLVVLHDTRLHHARAALLLRERRAAEYRAEFAWNHPMVSADAAELAVAGFDSRLYYEWSMVALLIASARLVAVHGEGARRDLAVLEASLSTPNSATPNSQAASLSTPNSATPNSQVASPPTPNSATPNSQQTPNSATPKNQNKERNSEGENAAGWSERIVAIRLGEGEIVTPEREAAARVRVRARYGIGEDAVVFGCFGGLTPEKRVPQILAAFRATLLHAPSAHLLLAGAPASHYDVAAEVAALRLSDRVTLTGYLETDEDLTDHLAASDVSLNLRWPTARETSGPWLRALAAGRATIVTELAHQTELPSLDPRTWTVRDVGGWRLEVGKDTKAPPGQPPGSSLRPPLCVAIDLLDEDHSLRLAMRRLATDPALRAQLGAAAREWWTRHHTPALMADDYEDAIKEAIARPPAAVDLPAHMRDEGLRRARALLDPFGVDVPF